MNLTLVGLGAVGTSIGLALKAAVSEIAITGHDPDSQQIARAKKLGAIDASHWNLISACENADLILLDLPLDEIEKTLRAVCRDLKERVLLMDTAAVKRSVMTWAKDILPETAQFVGGHIVSPRLARLHEAIPAAELLKGATFYLVAPEGASEWALDMASNLAAAIGAVPHYIDAVEHDGLIAATSHLPILAALAIMEPLRTQEGWQERRQAVGGEFAALNAILTNTPGIGELIFANADNVLSWLDTYTHTLLQLRQAIADRDNQTIQATAVQAIAASTEWMTLPQGDRSELGEEAGRLRWRDMFLGRLGQRARH
jgi:prephenate dehydrogenase